MTPEERFDRDVPEALREDVLTRLSEVVGGWAEYDDITVLEIDRYDAINARGHGIIEINGHECVWQLESGNWNGTELLAWEEDKPFERYERTEWALVPNTATVSKAILAGEGPFLVKKWNAIVVREPLASLVGKYAYDRMVQPGIKVEQHYKALAAKHGFTISTREEANSTRARLMIATESMQEVLDAPS